MDDLDRNPQVKGRLAEAEKNILARIAAGESYRTTISLDPVVALAAVRAADRERRDLSNLIAVAIEEFNGRCAPTSAHTELLAELAAALVANPDIAADLRRLITAGARRRRSRQPSTVAA